MVVQGFHIKIIVDSRFLDLHRHFQRMSGETGNQPVLFYQGVDLGQIVDFSPGHEIIADSSLDERPDSTVINGQLDIAGQIAHLGVGLGQPLDLPASFLAISIQQAHDMVIASEKGCIYAVFLAELDSIEHLFIRVVGFD